MLIILYMEMNLVWHISSPCVPYFRVMKLKKVEVGSAYNHLSTRAYRLHHHPIIIRHCSGIFHYLIRYRGE
jgi:hypothetical protein